MNQDERYADTISKAEQLLVSLGNLRSNLGNTKRREEWDQDEWISHSQGVGLLLRETEVLLQNIHRSKDYVNSIQDQSYKAPLIGGWWDFRKKYEQE